jgi:hypothetical protein
MDSLDTFVHPQAWAAALAAMDLSIAWLIAVVALITLARERTHDNTNPAITRKQRFA